MSDFLVGQLFTLLNIIGKLPKNGHLICVLIAEVFHSFHFLSVFFLQLFIHCKVNVKRYLYYIRLKYVTYFALIGVPDKRTPVEKPCQKMVLFFIFLQILEFELFCLDLLVTPLLLLIQFLELF